MKIRIDASDKIQAAIEAAEGRATSRTVSVSNIARIGEDAEQRLADAGIPKKLRSGATAVYDPWELPNSYRYRGAGTVVRVVRGSQRWYVASISRQECHTRSYGGNSRDLVVSLTRTPDVTASIERALPIQIVPS